MRKVRANRRGAYVRGVLVVAGLLTAASLIVVSISTASSSSATSGTASTYKKGLRLAFFASGGDNNYQKSGLQAAVDMGKKYGEKMKTYAAHFQDALQLNQIMGAISSGQFDGFIIEAINPGTVCSAVKAALAKHISVALTNVQACTTAYNVPYPGTAGYVGGQATSVYVKWFESAFSKYPQGGEFGVLVGPIQQGNSNRAKEAWGIVSKKYPKWKLAGNFLDTGYNAGPALTKTQNLIQSHPNIKLMFSNYSGQTPGAIAALRSAGKLGKVKIYDMGGDKSMFKALQAGQIEETLIFLPYEETVRGVQMVIGQLSGLKKFGPVKVGAFWDLTKDPKLQGLSPFVTKPAIAKYNKVGLPEY